MHQVSIPLSSWVSGMQEEVKSLKRSWEPQNRQLQLCKQSRSCHLSPAHKRSKRLFNHIGMRIYYRTVTYSHHLKIKKRMASNGSAVITPKPLFPQVSSKCLPLIHQSMWTLWRLRSLTTTGMKKKRTKRQLELSLVALVLRNSRQVATTRRWSPAASTKFNNTNVTLILRHQTKTKGHKPSQRGMIPSKRSGIEPTYWVPLKESKWEVPQSLID